jgi:hypothetical protein
MGGSAAARRPARRGLALAITLLPTTGRAVQRIRAADNREALAAGGAFRLAAPCASGAASAMPMSGAAGGRAVFRIGSSTPWERLGAAQAATATTNGCVTVIERIGSRGFGRNTLMQHMRFSPQSGEKPREFNVLLRTHAPQQAACLSNCIGASSPKGTSACQRFQ